jgi:hypothetical protein
VLGAIAASLLKREAAYANKVIAWRPSALPTGSVAMVCRGNTIVEKRGGSVARGGPAHGGGRTTPSWYHY